MANPLTSLSERLFEHAQSCPRTVALTRLKPDGTVGDSFDYSQVEKRTSALAALLIERGEQGRPVLIPERNSCDYVIAYLACLRAGAIAVTAYRPRSNDRSGRLQRIIEDAKPKTVLAAQETIDVFEGLPEQSLSRDCCIATDSSDLEQHPSIQLPTIDPQSVAMLQYTSGSTTTPRAVAITHENLIANLSIMSEVFYRPGSTATVCWLPLFHDMGLIGLVMTSLVNGITANIMAPEEFVMRPIRWLKAISDTRSAHSGGPNFAFELCVDRTTPAEREGLDLSCWQSAMNGAEVIRPETILRFVKTFEPYGFNEAAFQPCYGLAESTLVVSARRPGGPLQMPHISTSALQQDLVQLVSEDDENSRTVVTCGPPVPNQDVRILKPESDTFLGAGEVGEICVRGASVASEYYHRTEESKETFVTKIGTHDGPWLKTGDLGALLNGELLVVGRIKDLIIVGGMNHHPQDIERTAEDSHTGISRGGCAAFSLPSTDPTIGEQVVLIVEPTRDCYREIRKDKNAIEAVASDVEKTVRSAVSSEHAVRIEHCAFVAPGTIPRTTSGKIQRQACSKAWVHGKIPLLGFDLQT